MSNKSDLESMNSYVENRSAPAAGAPASVVSRWEAYRSQWRAWYPGVVGSWYVSDSDLKHAKLLRNSMMWNQNPANWNVDPGGVASSDTDKPKMKKGLVPSKHLSKQGIADLQKRINAAGYTPPLKVDGKYGKATKAGELWLRSRESESPNVPAKRPDPAEQAVAMLGGPRPKPRPSAAPSPATPSATPAKAPAKSEAVAAAPYSVLGVPVGIKSVVAAVAGTGAGWLAGGPVGAAIGIPVGWFGSKLIPEKKS